MKDIYHKGANELDMCVHRVMESPPNPAWHGSTMVDDYLAFYHEERLYAVRHIKKGICCLVYAESPYDAISRVREMEK